MIDKPSTEEELVKEIDRLFEEINNGLEMIGRRDIKDMTPEEFRSLLVKAPFTLSSPLKDHYKQEK